ncbi:hypothetical protein [Thalassobacillus sp. B23F22_16]|uniref:hypothetical protein n=1 Tax=Thalassobacillus sp. B23F22_16 TaxID=3459513 RepID=UPI00373E38B2
MPNKLMEANIDHKLIYIVIRKCGWDLKKKLHFSLTLDKKETFFYYRNKPYATLLFSSILPL